MHTPRFDDARLFPPTHQKLRDNTGPECPAPASCLRRNSDARDTSTVYRLGMQLGQYPSLSVIGYSYPLNNCVALFESLASATKRLRGGGGGRQWSQ